MSQPSQSSFFISLTMSSSPYNCLTSSLVLLLQYPATHIGPNIFLSIFLYQTRKFFSPFAVKHHTSEPHSTTGLIMNLFYKYEYTVVKFMYEFFGCDYCISLTINMLCQLQATFIQLLNLLERFQFNKVYLYSDTSANEDNSFRNHSLAAT